MARIEAGELEATVAAGAVLSVTGLRHREVELLVAPDELPARFRVHGRAAGITLLHPWANRLGADSFTVAGAELRVTPGDPSASRDAGGLPIHGLLASEAWKLTRHSPAALEARASFPALPAFPFAHAMAVGFALRPPARLEVRTTLTPAGTGAVPVAFGWHPYLRLPWAPRAEWRLVLPRRRALGLDARGLPDGSATWLAPEDAPLGDRTFDDGYDCVGDGAAWALAAGGREVRVTHVRGYPAAQVFAPAAADVVSLEPMTAPTDALRTGSGLRLVEPGTTCTALFTLDVLDV